ncbi:MAG: hypothetical protein E6F99_01615 [Actinobacteria bacterium]|nr:MAG: hypothetical protein E6F99_01615 [Actinomycetota bacterium]
MNCARIVDPDQACPFGRCKGVSVESGYPRRQVRAVGDRGQQQRRPSGGGKYAELRRHHGREPVGQRERLGHPAPARGRVGGDHLRQFDQRQRVAGRLRKHLLPRIAAWRVRLGIE